MFYNKLLLLTALFLISVVSYSQEYDTIRLVHKKYYSIYDKKLRHPILVRWNLSKKDLDCEVRVHRTNRFRPDPALPFFTSNASFYLKSGYDKGHNMPAADCKCDSTAMQESFYFSNISPQVPFLNRKLWNELEEESRKLAIQYEKVDIICGCYGQQGKLKELNIPENCWKIIKYGNKTDAYLFSNQFPKYKLEDFRSFILPVDSLIKKVPFIKPYLKSLAN